MFWQAVPLLYSSVVSQQSVQEKNKIKSCQHNKPEKKYSADFKSHTADPIIDTGGGDEGWSKTSIGAVETAIWTSGSACK